VRSAKLPRPLAFVDAMDRQHREQLVHRPGVGASENTENWRSRCWPGRPAGCASSSGIGGGWPPAGQLAGDRSQQAPVEAFGGSPLGEVRLGRDRKGGGASCLNLIRSFQHLLQVVAAAGLGARPRFAERCRAVAQQSVVRLRSAAAPAPLTLASKPSTSKHAAAEMAGDSQRPLSPHQGGQGNAVGARSTRARWPHIAWRSLAAEWL